MKRDRTRIAAISCLPEAAANAGLALKLATTTDLSVDQIKVALAATPTATVPGGVSDAALSFEQPKSDASAAVEAASLWDAALASRGMRIR
ncbi:hypothetical protein [Bradyrhizobium sp. LA6.10]|uniref:hypothetical protein n=1 Tax=Bradyrhizobium sp. LA6.10 TaxID=3156318 RepID=UPI0033957B80